MISIFDLDHTLINANSSYCFGVFLYRKGVLSLPKALYLATPYLLHKAGWISLNSLHNQIFNQLFKGQESKLFSAYVEEFLDTYLEGLLRPSIIQQLIADKAEGGTVALFSSSPDFLVDPIAKRLKIDHVLSSQYLVDKEGLFAKIPFLVTGDEKRRTLQQMQQEAPNAYTTAYSDSLEDLPLLEAVSRPVCVFPDRHLKKIALIKQWEVIDHGCKIQRN